MDNLALVISILSSASVSQFLQYSTPSVIPDQQKSLNPQLTRLGMSYQTSLLWQANPHGKEAKGAITEWRTASNFSRTGHGVPLTTLFPKH